MNQPIKCFYCFYFYCFLAICLPKCGCDSSISDAVDGVSTGLASEEGVGPLLANPEEEIILALIASCLFFLDLLDQA